MKVRLFIMLVCSIMLLGFNATAMSATSDATGDSCVPEVDIEAANIEIYEPNEQDAPQKAKFYLKMADTTHLPGYVIWDIDMDQDLNTGIDSSVLNMPFATADCSGTGGEPAVNGPWKDPTGVDFYVVMALRTQGHTGTMANCGGCVGGPLCGLKGAGCSGGGNCGTSFQATGSCAIGSTDPNCKALGPIENCNEGDCYPLVNDCIASKNCAEPMFKGEYRVQVVNGSSATTHGDVILPALYDITEENEICFTLNWSKLLVTAGLAGGGDIRTDLPPKFAVSAWYDPNQEAGDKDDFFANPALVLHMVDYMPNTFAEYATGTREMTPDCIGNYSGSTPAPFSGQRSVGADDVSDGLQGPLTPAGFLDEWNKRSGFQNKCPACD